MFKWLMVTVIVLLASCASQQTQNLYQGSDTNAAVIISGPTVLVEYIDNDTVKSGFIGQENSYRVAAGDRQILVTYSDLFDINADEHQKVVSRPAKILFTAQAGKRYRIESTKPSSLEQAQAFKEQPEFFVLDLISGNRIPATVELSRPRSFISQLKSSVTPAYEFASDQVPEVKTEAIGRLDQLQLLWNQASPAEKDAFLQWATPLK